MKDSDYIIDYLENENWYKSARAEIVPVAELYYHNSDNIEWNMNHIEDEKVLILNISGDEGAIQFAIPYKEDLNKVLETIVKYENMNSFLDYKKLTLELVDIIPKFYVDVSDSDNLEVTAENVEDLESLMDDYYTRNSF